MESNTQNHYESQIVFPDFKQKLSYQHSVLLVPPNFIYSKGNIPWIHSTMAFAVGFPSTSITFILIEWVLCTFGKIEQQRATFDSRSSQSRFLLCFMSAVWAISCHNKIHSNIAIFLPKRFSCLIRWDGIAVVTINASSISATPNFASLEKIKRIAASVHSEIWSALWCSNGFN